MINLSGLKLEHLLSSKPLEASVDQSDFVEQEEHERGFAAYFDREIKPLREAVEARRIEHLESIRRRFRRVLPFIALLFILVVGGTVAGIMGWFSIGWAFGMFFLFGLIALLILFALFPAYEYQQSVKTDLLGKLAGFYGDDWSYHVEEGFDEAIVAGRPITPPYRRFERTDCFNGMYRDVRISFAEVRLVTPQDRGKPLINFQGLCLLFSMNKRFEGNTVVARDSGSRWIGGNKKQLGDLQRVELEDPEFEAMFEVYSSDQIEARYLLTTAFMDRTLQLSRFLSEAGAGAGIQFEFRDENLFMMIPSTVDYFEPGTVFEPSVRIADLRKFLREMTLIFGIVDVLKLNLKIGL